MFAETSSKPLNPPNKRASARSLFASWSNHMANSVNCVPETRSSATRTTVAVAISFPPEDPRGGDDEAEEEADDGHQGPQHVEEHERMEVADHVLLLHPPPEALEQQPGDPRPDAAEADAERSPTP